MKYKTFNYKDYKNCWFEVGNYANPKQSMYIEIVNKDEGEITVATVNMADYFYSPDTATIKNYSENSGMTKFLEELGIVEEIYTRRKANDFAGNNETIDYCQINIEELEKYSKKFDYIYTF